MGSLTLYLGEATTGNRSTKFYVGAGGRLKVFHPQWFACYGSIAFSNIATGSKVFREKAQVDPQHEQIS